MLTGILQQDCTRKFNTERFLIIQYKVSSLIITIRSGYQETDNNNNKKKGPKQSTPAL